MTAPVRPVQLFNSQRAGGRPGDGLLRSLLRGELFLNLVDGVLCWQDDAAVTHTTPLRDLATNAALALALVPYARSSDVDGKVAAAVAALVNSSPATLDTLKELADALGDDPNYAATTAAALALRLRVDAAQALTAAQKAQGLANLGAQAALAYAPARPSLVASASGASLAGLGIGAGSLTALVSVSFVATAPNVKIDAAACFSCPTSGGSENVFAYCSLFNADAGSSVGVGTTAVTTVLYGNGFRQLGASYVYTGLNIGQNYTATFYAYQGDGSAAVNTADQVINVQNV